MKAFGSTGHPLNVRFKTLNTGPGIKIVLITDSVEKCLTHVCFWLLADVQKGSVFRPESGFSRVGPR